MKAITAQIELFFCAITLGGLLTALFYCAYFIYSQFKYGQSWREFIGRNGRAIFAVFGISSAICTAVLFNLFAKINI